LIKSDITIIGAGPAGITAAIALARRGIPSLLIDRNDFPRQKICGDGLSGKVVSILNRLNAGYVSELYSSGIATGSRAARFYAPNLKMMELSFQTGHHTQPPGLICKRIDFDHFLLKKALAFKEIHFECGKQVDSIIKENGYLKLQDSSGSIIAESRLLLFAGGSNLNLIRQLNPSFPDIEEGIGVRGYFENVTGSDEKHPIEIHFLKELLPWYLWIFPFSDGSANVGLALPESLAKKNRLSLKDLLFHLIQSYPHLKNRFINSTLSGKIEANRLPYYTSQCQVAGDHYMLLGDAARLIDPFTGEGIGNAMASGIYAAEVASGCIAGKDFSVDNTKNYQELIDSKLGRELALSLKLQVLARRQNLLNLVIGRASRNEKTRSLISEMLYNQDTKLKLSKPEFYIKILLGL
jgi:geranylgeranyl reductase family protein